MFILAKSRTTENYMYKAFKVGISVRMSDIIVDASVPSPSLKKPTQSEVHSKKFNKNITKVYILFVDCNRSNGMFFFQKSEFQWLFSQV